MASPTTMPLYPVIGRPSMDGVVVMIIRLFPKVQVNRCFDLFYENLIKKPEETLKNMFQFLGETWEPDVLNYHKFEHGFGTEDPIVRGTTGFTPNFDNWQAFSSEQLSSILPIVEDVMKELGYSLDNSKFPSYTKSV